MRKQPVVGKDQRRPRDDGKEQRERVAPFKRRVQDDPAVQQCYSITGDGDFLLLVSAASMEEYEAITERLFGADDNIERFRTAVALSTLKRGLDVPLAE